MVQRPRQPDVPDETRESVGLFRVAVCIPAQDTVATGFAYDLARMMAFTAASWMPDLIGSLQLYFAAGTLVAPQRHELVGRAIAGEATHILWLDSDMRFPKDTLIRLMHHGKPIVAANYCSRRMPPVPVALSFISETTSERKHLYTTDESTGLVPVEGVGMGVMLTAVDVFRRIGTPYFHIDWSPTDEMYQGEDIFFCKRARKFGLEVLVDQDLSGEISHVGAWHWEHGHANDIRAKLEEQMK